MQRVIRRSFDKLARKNIFKTVPTVFSRFMKNNNLENLDAILEAAEKGTNVRSHEKSEARIQRLKENFKKLPKMNFESYITEEECHEGLKSCKFISGELKVNVKRYRDAYIKMEDSRDVKIEGIEMRNRALPGDIVAVELFSKDTDNTSSDSNARKKGKVVYIMQEKHSRLVVGYLTPFRNNFFGFALLTPVDGRLPRIMIPLSECSANFRTRPKDCEKTIYVGKITSWGLNMAYASGKLVRTLGEAGHVEPETEAILVENNIDSSDFPENVIDCLPDGDTWKVTEEELAKRKDLRNACIFSIDPATARDLDDALSCKKMGKDLYEVGVHIADVSHFIEEGCELDKVAKNRATSTYMVQKVIHMLPRVLCEQLCSLNPGVERLAYSVIWKIKSDGTIVDEWFGRSVIRSCVKLSYDHAQQMITSVDNDLLHEEYPDITGNFTISEICGVVKDLYNLSQCLRKKRLESGALDVNAPKMSFSLDSESGLPDGYRVDEPKDSNKLIEEFMLLANIAVAIKILQAHPKEAVLRHHPPPDMSDSKTFNNLPKPTEFDVELHPYINAALTLMHLKILKLAQYFCAGSVDDLEKYHHYGLNIDIYTHFTSPIRRYPDIMVHRLLTAALDEDFKVNSSTKELQEICTHCNEKRLDAKTAGEQSVLLFLTLYVKECGPFTDKGVIVNISSKEIDVLSIRLGIVYRVNIRKLTGVKCVYRKEGVKKLLTLHWQNGSDTKNESPYATVPDITVTNENLLENLVTSASTPIKQVSNEDDMDNKEGTGIKHNEILELPKQELTIFSPVNTILTVDSNEPTKLLATLVNPLESIEHIEHGL